MTNLQAKLACLLLCFSVRAFVASFQDYVHWTSATGGTARLALTFLKYESGATSIGKLVAMRSGVAGTLQDVRQLVRDGRDRVAMKDLYRFR